jgi:AbrB family looped-hinge helix DNA binding protein
VVILSELITVSDRGQITIPVRFREKLLIEAGDKLYCDLVDGVFVCKKPLDFFSFKGCLGKIKIPENEEELFAGAVAQHVMEDE